MLPYPFTHHQQFERTIQNPIGSTWNTQRAFQKLTAPKIITKAGHIIKPIKAEDVGYQSSPRSDLSVMQSNPKGHSKHKKQLKKSSIDWIVRNVLTIYSAACPVLQNELQNWLNTLCVVKPYLGNKEIFTFITRLLSVLSPCWIIFFKSDTLSTPALYFSTYHFVRGTSSPFFTKTCSWSWKRRFYIWHPSIMIHHKYQFIMRDWQSTTWFNLRIQKQHVQTTAGSCPWLVMEPSWSGVYPQELQLYLVSFLVQSGCCVEYHFGEM